MPAKHMCLRFLEATTERSDLSARPKPLFFLLAVPSILLFPLHLLLPSCSEKHTQRRERTLLPTSAAEQLLLSASGQNKDLSVPWGQCWRPDNTRASAKAGVKLRGRGDIRSFPARREEWSLSFVCSLQPGWLQGPF